MEKGINQANEKCESIETCPYDGEFLLRMEDKSLK